MTISVIALLNGCGSDSQPTTGAETASADANLEVELGCAGCIFKMEGAEGCQTAAKVDGKTYMVEGGGVDAHAAGLCANSKEARVRGRIEGDHLIVSQIKIRK